MPGLSVARRAVFACLLCAAALLAGPTGAQAGSMGPPFDAILTAYAPQTPQMAVADSGVTTFAGRTHDGLAAHAAYSRVARDGTILTSQTDLTPFSDSVNDYDVAVAGTPAGVSTIAWGHGAGSVYRIQTVQIAADGTAGPVVDVSPAGQYATNAQVGVGVNGIATIVWWEIDGTSKRLIRAAQVAPDGTVGAVQTLSDPATDSFTPQIASDADGDATIVYVQDGKAKAVRLSSAGVAGPVLTLSAAPLVSDQVAAQPQVAVSPAGIATAVWRRYDGASRRIEAARIAADGTAGSVIDLTAAGTENASPMPAVATSGVTTVVWNELQGNWRVKTRQIAADGTPGAITDLTGPGERAGPADVAAGPGGASVIWEIGSPLRVQEVQLKADGTPTAVRTVSPSPGSSGGAVAVTPDGYSTVAWVRFQDIEGTPLYIVQGKVLRPQTLTPEGLTDFPAKHLDQGPTAAKTFTLASTDGGSQTISSVALEGQELGDYAITENGCAVGITLASGQTCDIKVAFDPTARGMRRTTLAVVTDVGRLIASLQGVGFKTFLAGPGPLSFGGQDIDDGSVAIRDSKVVFSNGDGDVSVASIQVTGADAGQFTLLSDDQYDCKPGYVLHAAMGGCLVRVLFDPTSVGAKTATLKLVGSEGPDLDIPLSGTGTQTGFALTSGPVDFGTREVSGGAGVVASTLKNTGTETIQIQDVTMGGSNPGDFTPLADNPADCKAGASVAAGQTCALRLSFDPSADGLRGATATVTSNTAPVVVSASGTGIRTELTRGDPALALGSRDVDDGAAPTQETTFRNTGTEPLTLTGVTVSGPGAAAFTPQTGAGDDCAAGPLGVGAVCKVRVAFDPSATGIADATLKVASNAPDATVALSGTGTQTELTAAPASLVFAPRDVDAGAAPVQEATVTNTGTEPVTLSGVSVTGDGADLERLTGDAGDCASATVLNATQTCKLRLRFDPSTTGAKAVTVTVASGAADVTVGAAGAGTDKVSFAVAPGARAFDDRDIAAGPSDAQAFTVTNAGSRALAVGDVTLAGAGADQFSISKTTCAAPVAKAGGTCSVEVAFDPSSSGAKAATLRFVHDGEDSPATVTLSGTGTKAPDPPVDPGPKPQPQPAPQTRPAPDPVPVVSSATLLVSGAGRFPVLVSCTKSPKGCAGTITVRSAKAIRLPGEKVTRIITLATGKVAVDAGASRTVKLKLSSTSRRIVKLLVRVKVAVTVSLPRPAAKPTERTFTRTLTTTRR
jgi:hypothetical protein